MNLGFYDAWRWLSQFALITACWMACSVDQSAAAEHRLLAGLALDKLDQPVRGQVLFSELNCIQCHRTESPVTANPKTAPRLANVGARLNPHYVEQFIQSPHDVKPGTTMPDVMSHFDDDQRSNAAKSITNFLLSLDRSREFALQAIDTVAAEQGRELFHTVGCVACHSPRDDDGKELLAETSTPLGVLEKKYNTRSLSDFLRRPHHTRPAGRMPDMRLSDQQARRIAHYLLEKTQVPGHLRYTHLRGRVWEGLDVNVTKEKSGLVDDFDLANLPQLPGNSAVIYEGFLQVERAGEYTFHLEANGGQLWLNDAEVLNLPASSRRGVKKSQGKVTLPAGWNQIKLVYIHAGKEPRMGFSVEGPEMPRQAIDAARLTISKTPIKPYQPYEFDSGLAADGKRFFSELGCANCHDDARVDRQQLPDLAKLNSKQGCLSDDDGAWPDFGLSVKQQSLLRQAVTSIEEAEPLDDATTIDKSLVTFNCIACHDRTDLGGVSPDRNEYFVGSKKELGNEGRIPPPLTHVGAKLQPSWIKEVMLHGRQQRTYQATVMPQFGEGNVGHLVELFGKVDQVEKVKFDKIEDIERVKQAGHQLVGTTGFSCIACHDFNGQQAAGPGAMEIIHSTERLKKDWFYLFMLDPARFRPNTIMPQAWPGGHAFKKDILDGDTKKQIESIWVYLEDGTRAKNPSGLSRKAPELRVTDEPVICRGRGTAGYRGIGVGYPRRISLAFDSEEVNLRLLWKGEFANSSPGRFSPRGHDRIEFPPGIPFHRLKSLDDDWPYKRKTDYLFPQDHGYQFRGYYLDKQKRPTFMYEYGDIQIEEFFEDRLDGDKNAYFRRTIRFDAPADVEKFFFRAATAKKIAVNDDQKPHKSFQADKLTVILQGDHTGVIREGEPAELLVPLQPPEGKSTLILEYRW